MQPKNEKKRDILVSLSWVFNATESSCQQPCAKDLVLPKGSSVSLWHNRAQLRSIRYSDLDGIELNPKSIYQVWDHRGVRDKESMDPVLEQTTVQWRKPRI